jgi:lipoprotein-anchoring transpeptidase ErfK/SrfK
VTDRPGRGPSLVMLRTLALAAVFAAAAVSPVHAAEPTPSSSSLPATSLPATSLPSATQPATTLPTPARTAHRVTVVLDEQRAYVYAADGALLGRWKISSGGPGHRTPTGRYRVTTRTRTGTSGSSPNVHMDYFVRFNGGIGFHGIPWRTTRANRLWTPLGRYGVSHGCIRMADSHARRLYRELPPGAHVRVVASLD